MATQYLDDDINTVIAYNAVKTEQKWMEVLWVYNLANGSRNHTGDNLSGDNGNWDALYQRINSMNIILHELGNESEYGTGGKGCYPRQGECYFLRAQFYLMLVNLYAKAYDPDNAATEPGVSLKLTYYVEHDKEKETNLTVLGS
ncbi:MAG: RagB/SusD family nutrient uptake outer membrane protein [Butyricimonas faecalis]